MANQYTKGIKRKGETPATQRPAKRAHGNEVEQDEPKQSVQAPTKKRGTSEHPEEGGEGGQKLFEDVEKNASEGRALGRGDRER